MDIVFLFRVQVSTRTNLQKLFEGFVLDLNEAIKNNHYYVSGIIHDLRNPISCLQSFFELLESQLPANALKPDMQQMMHSCKKSSENVVVMVSNILDYSKMQNGNLEVNNKPEKLFGIIKNCVDLHHTKAIQKGIKIFVHLNPHRIPKRVFLDGVRITQILNNLLSNAIKFTERGGVSIWVKWIPKKGSE